MQKCRIDGSELIPVMDFGNIYFSDFVDNPKDGFKSPLKVGMCEKCGLVQLFDAPDPNKMFRQYWYRSGINESMIKALKDIVDKTKNYVQINTGDTVLDIGGNDGTLLDFWTNDVVRIGIDPARNFEKYYQGKCEHFIEDFFSSENYWSVAKQRAKAIFSIAMFYDLPDPVWFVKEVKNCLCHDGIWVIQLSYLPLTLQQNSFPDVCHEHIEYYTLNVVNNLLKDNGFKIIDAKLNDVNSGSIRIYITHENNKITKLPLHSQILGEFRVKSLLEYEKSLKLDTSLPYFQFVKRVEKEKEKTLKLLTDLKKQGKLVIGYGASTKGNTLLQYYNITPDLISYIADRTKEKWGKVTIGTNIKIISENEMREMKPDFLFIFPWHFIDQFKKREKDLRENGTKFIVPLPQLSIE